MDRLNCVFLHCSTMQRASRLKRELHLLTTEPPPGITCWQNEGRLDYLRARRCLAFNPLPHLSRRGIGFNYVGKFINCVLIALILPFPFKCWVGLNGDYSFFT